MSSSRDPASGSGFLRNVVDLSVGLPRLLERDGVCRFLVVDVRVDGQAELAVLPLKTDDGGEPRVEVGASISLDLNRQLGGCGLNDHLGRGRTGSVVWVGQVRLHRVTSRDCLRGEDSEERHRPLSMSAWRCWDS